MIEWDNVEESIKKTQNPFILLTYLFINKSMLLDDDLSFIIRYFMKYHYDLFFKKDMRKTLYLLNNYNISKNIIYDFYKNLIKQKELVNIIKLFKNGYNRLYFWSKNNNDKINYLINLQNKFNSYNDCSIGNIQFHRKLRVVGINDNYSQVINQHEIFERLKLIYKMFGSKLFHTYNITLLSYEDFDNFDYKLKCDYVEYIYNNINIILEKIIDTIKLYDYTIEQMNRYINPIPIDIEIGIFTSEIEDIDF